MKAAGVVRRGRRAVPGLANDEAELDFGWQAAGDKPHTPRRVNAVIDLVVDIMVDDTR